MSLEIHRGEVVQSLIHSFYVPMGHDNLRIVYNSSGCSLNVIVCVPHFILPTMMHTTLGFMLGYSYWDLDIVEMFPSFFLCKHMKQGVCTKAKEEQDMGYGSRC